LEEEGNLGGCNWVRVAWKRKVNKMDITKGEGPGPARDGGQRIIERGEGRRREGEMKKEIT